MPVQFVPKAQQATGAFNGGEITENKPLGFPREGGVLKPYSSLFYWAHAFAHTDSEIGLHPHRGFEIMSFVLRGTIRHFDTQLNGWQRLHEGDAQVIRAGSGISHAEFMENGSEMFQIWLDPNLNKTLQHPPSYSDYGSAEFPTEDHGNGRTDKVYVGNNSPFALEAEGIGIREITLAAGDHRLSLDPTSTYSIYQLTGSSTVGDHELAQYDFLKIDDETSVTFRVRDSVRLFLIQSPGRLEYPTYAQLMQARMR